MTQTHALVPIIKHVKSINLQPDKIWWNLPYWRLNVIKIILTIILIGTESHVANVILVTIITNT